MINLIRMNLIHMFQMKCTYIMLLVCFLISIIFVTEAQDTSTQEMEQQMIEEQQQESSDQPQVGIVIDTTAEEATIAWDVAQFVSSGFFAIMIGIFMSILACGEHDSGFLKNLAPCSQHKWQIAVARIVPGFVMTMMLQVTFFLSLLAVNVLYKNPLSVGDVVGLLPVIGVQILLHTAFAAFILVIAEITRSALLSNLVSIFVGFGFGGLIVSYIAPKLLEYMLLSRIQITTLPLDFSMVPTSVIVGLVALIVYIVLNGFIFQKRDTY